LKPAATPKKRTSKIRPRKEGSGVSTNIVEENITEKRGVKVSTGQGKKKRSDCRHLKRKKLTKSPGRT